MAKSSSNKSSNVSSIKSKSEPVVQTLQQKKVVPEQSEFSITDLVREKSSPKNSARSRTLKSIRILDSKADALMKQLRGSALFDQAFAISVAASALAKAASENLDDDFRIAPKAFEKDQLVVVVPRLHDKYSDFLDVTNNLTVVRVVAAGRVIAKDSQGTQQVIPTSHLRSA